MTRDEADAYLHDAICLAAEAYDMECGDLLLNQWAVVCHWQSIENTGTSTYTTHYPGEEMPTHIAAGLFRVGERHCFEEDD